MRARERKLILGSIPIDATSFAEAMRVIDRMIESRAGGAAYTPNVDHVVQAEEDQALRAAYEDADLRLADGTPIVWASWLLGGPILEKISGSDLTMPLLRLAEARGWRVYLFGGGSGVGEQAALRCLDRHPRLRIVGVDDTVVSLDQGDPSFEAICDRIRQTHAQLVLVALGCPKQEIWIHRARRVLPSVAFVGVGSSLDYIAGTLTRAPRWMSRVGLEWLFRLLTEPRRLWRRYLLRDPRFLGVLLRSARARRALRPITRLSPPENGAPSGSRERSERR